jgi:UMF1 family MFS transporter
MSFLNKRVVAWALYDWANSAFATTVMAAFFPIFFQRFWGAGSDAAASTSRLGFASAFASVLVAASAPLLGSIADKGGAKKKLLALFAMVGVLNTGGLFFVAEGSWLPALVLFAVATIGFAGGNIFYDALIVGVAPAGKIDVVSAFGFALGYGGGGLLLALNSWMVNAPATFGFDGPATATRVSFLLVALWWGVFTLPILFVVPEPESGGTSFFAAARQGVSEFKQTIMKLKKLRVATQFLLAYWFYIDGVDTVIRMATDYGARLNLDAGDMVQALLITQFVGVPAALAFGKVGERVGAKRAIFFGLAVYVVVVAWGAFIDSTREFYMLAIFVGLVQGGVQSLSRSLFVRLIPASHASELFGFYNMLGKFAAVIGPMLMGFVAMFTDSPRWPLLSLILLFVIGGALLSRVDEKKGEEMAKSYDEI